MKNLLVALLAAVALAAGVVSLSPVQAGGWGTTPGAMYQDWSYNFETQPPDQAPYTVRYMVIHGVSGLNVRQTASAVLEAEEICQFGDPDLPTLTGDPWLGTGFPCVFTGAIPLFPEKYHGASR